MTAQLLIDRFGVSAVTNTGIAGGAGNAHVRDVVISTDITYHDMELRILALGYPNLEFFQADKALQQAAAAACEGHLRYHLGRIVTGDQFISSKEVKEEIVSRLHPLAVEGFCIDGLLDYQFRQTGQDAFEMLAETAENADRDMIQAEMLRQMKEILREKGLNYVQF